MVLNCHQLESMKDYRILLLGSGELGKELCISLQRMGVYVIACDSYPGAPAMQVAHDSEVFSMLDGEALKAAVAKHKPTHIVPEIEAIKTDLFYGFEEQGIQVVPSAKAANFTMNRKLIRDLAAKDLGVRTAPYAYADNINDFKKAIGEIGFPCVVKPLMSSSGKGQSVLKTIADIEPAFAYAMEGSRGDLMEVIVEGFVDFHTEITLLTVTQKNGETLFCNPIGHRQERGDFQESWQPCAIAPEHLKTAQEMAAKVTKELEGEGIWGVEFFIADDGVYFSELSPRPHDTGMVTLCGTQNFTQFELHARTILGLPIPTIRQEKSGVCAALLAQESNDAMPNFVGLEKVLTEPNTDFRIFRKPTTRPYRRMGVLLKSSAVDADMEALINKTKVLRDTIKVKS